MNNISKQYYEFLKTLQKIFHITDTKGIKITKIDQGIICFQNEKGNDIEISTAHDVVEYCSNNLEKRKLFTYDGVKTQPIDKDGDNNESIDKVSLVYDEKEINFFSFVVNCLAEDYMNPARNKELKKTLSVTQVTLYLKKFITDPNYNRQLYNYINNEDLVQPLVDTMDQIKDFLEQNKVHYFNRLSVDKENKTISLGFTSQEVIISQNDIPTANKNRYNIDYYGSILECLDKDIKSNGIITRYTFTVDQFYEKLLPYHSRFDCLVSIKSIASTIEDQKIDKLTNAQEASTRYNMPLSYTQTSINSSTEHRDLIPDQPSGNGQQSTALLVASVFIPGLILFAFIFAYCYMYKKRNNDKVRTEIETVDLVSVSDRSRQNGCP